MQSKSPFLSGVFKGLGTVLSGPKAGLQYQEEAIFKVLRSEPAFVINWQQFTKHAESQAPLHAENGFLKILPVMAEDKNKAELMLSHPFSLQEQYKGLFDFEGNTLVCEANEEGSFLRGATAKGKAVTAMKREYKWDPST